MELIYTRHLVASGATVDETRYLPTYRKMRLTKVMLVPNSATSDDSSNYLTLSVKNGSTTLATRTTQSSALAAGVSETLTLSGGEALNYEDLGEIELKKTHSGTGATCDVEFLLVFEPARDF